MSFLKELKRRNVFRVAIAYLVVGWLLVQVLGIATDSFEAPAWVMKLFITLIVIGFIPTVLFSWAFELTPEGLKKESEIQTSNSQTAHTAKKLDYITILAAVAVAGMFTWQQMRPVSVATQKEDTQKEQTQKQDIQDKAQEVIQEPEGASIAVLAFVNMSSDPEQEYFSDGISEEILNVLAKIDGLSVAARTSSFFYKGQNLPIGEIAMELGVKHILEGSVRKSGSQIRITAQLIRAEDGFHLWSETYDRELENIFEIQDEISLAIVKELRGRLMSETPEIVDSGTTNTEAYEEYLKGWYYWNLRTLENLNRAQVHFERATELDAEYANA